MNEPKPLLGTLCGKVIEPPPLWLMRQAGRYLPEYRALRQKAGSFLELCLTPEFATEATLQPVRRFGFDGAILFSDILVIAMALGRTVEFRDGDGPNLLPLSDKTGLTAQADAETLAPVYEALRRVKAALPARTTLLGFAGGPWTVAAYIIDGGGRTQFAKARQWAAEKPDVLDGVVARLAAATADHLAAQLDAGAEAVQLFDSWAGLLAPDQFRRFVIAPTRRIVAALHARHPRAPIIGFPRNAGALYGDYFVETGVDALCLDPSVPLDQARALQAHGPVQGNLDPALLLAGGAALDRAVGDILAALHRRPFVFNLGHGILPETPLEHVERLVQLVRGGL
ncbi:MAG: uroporphyrinogen decarboxylase [Alphaproteobacteria bacterium]|nr:uroporphyrinogen decarboxylase [Alphaproteobacteria bacterium]